MSQDAAVSEQTGTPPREELANSGYEIFIAALSVLSILNLVMIYTINDSSLDYVLQSMNLILSLVLFIDFLYRMKIAPSKSQYFFREFGWADLLASMPLLQLKLLRVFRLIKVYRLGRKHGAHGIMRALIHDRASSALWLLLIVATLVLEFGSLGILRIEGNAPGSNIHTASDALWYIIVTISTVGYGDQFPVTNPGRVMGAGIIVLGVGIFGTLTGFLANAFISPKAGDDEEELEESPGAELAEAMHAPSLDEKVDDLHRMLAEQQRTIARLEELLSSR